MFRKIVIGLGIVAALIASFVAWRSVSALVFLKVANVWIDILWRA